MKILTQLLPVCFFLISTIGMAQQYPNSIKRVGITVIGIDFSYEKPVDFNKSLLLSTELVYDFYKSGGISGEKSGWGLTPLIYAEPRWYFNLKKRQEKNKKTVFNSANYLGVYLGYRFKPLLNENLALPGNFFVVPNLGFQRTIGKRITIDPKIGYSFMFQDPEFFTNSIFFDLKISWVILLER